MCGLLAGEPPTECQPARHGRRYILVNPSQKIRTESASSQASTQQDECGPCPRSFVSTTRGYSRSIDQQGKIQDTTQQQTFSQSSQMCDGAIRPKTFFLHDAARSRKRETTRFLNKLHSPSPTLATAIICTPALSTTAASTREIAKQPQQILGRAMRLRRTHRTKVSARSTWIESTAVGKC